MLSQDIRSLILQGYKMEFIDLKSQQRRIRPALDLAINRVMEHGRYVMGPEVAKLEQALAPLAQSKFVLGCANGTDALTLACLLYTSPSPRDATLSHMPSSA